MTTIAPLMHSAYSAIDDAEDPLVTVRMRRQVYTWLDHWLQGDTVGISWETAELAVAALQHVIGSWTRTTPEDDDGVESVENQYHRLGVSVGALTHMLNELAASANGRRIDSGIELLTDSPADPSCTVPLPALDDYTVACLDELIHDASQTWMRADPYGRVDGTSFEDDDEIRMEQIWWRRVERELVPFFRRIHDAYPTPYGAENDVIYPNVALARTAYEAWHAAHVHTAAAHGPVKTKGGS